MQREELYKVLFDQQKEFNEQNGSLIFRDIETEIDGLVSAKMPIIITGIRRCGKSTLLKLLKEQFKLKTKDFLYINFNDERLIGFDNSDFQKITEYLQEQNYNSRCTLFIDEIQEIENWEKWIDRIKDKYSIFITGSNSKLLSSELSTIMTGRALTSELYPFSFKEFLSIKLLNLKNINIDTELQSKIRVLLQEYLEFGGFPKRVITKQNQVLSELFENIIYKDILSRFNSKQAVPVKEAIQYMISNTSKPLSTRQLSDLIGIKNLLTIKKIMDALEGAFLIFTVRKFDYSIKKQIQNPKKIYCIDNGLITVKGFKTSPDNGRLLENCVFMELKRRKKEIYYHKNKKECDFVIKEGTKIIQAIQVCYELSEENKIREIDGLLDPLEQYALKEGYIITMDKEEKIIMNGKIINVVPVWKWLLQDSINNKK